jgi:hypothetical protein
MMMTISQIPYVLQQKIKGREIPITLMVKRNPLRYRRGDKIIINDDTYIIQNDPNNQQHHHNSIGYVVYTLAVI